MGQALLQSSVMNRDQLLRAMRERVHHPVTARDLVRVLKIAKQDRAALKRVLRSLVADGALIEVSGNRYGLADRMDLVVGRFEAHPSGFAFVTPERPIEGAKGDIYIAAPNVKEALHGDRVVVRVEQHRADGRVEGRIVRVLERRTQTIVGRYELDAAGLGYVLPFDRRVLTDVHIPRDESADAEPGEMVTVEITRWPTPSRGPVGKIIEVLGSIDAPGVDTEIILRKHAIPDEHSEQSIEEAR